MIGLKGSVLTKLRDKNPNVFSIGCICHLASLCVKDGVKALQFKVDDLLVDIFYVFHHSSKRIQEFKAFQEFTEVDEDRIFFIVLFAIFILHSRESELYRYTLDGKSALAWELHFSRFMGHLSST